MVLKASSENRDMTTVSNAFKNDVLKTAAHTTDKKQIEASIFKFVEKLGNCDILERWANGIEQELKKRDVEIDELQAQEVVLEDISEEKFTDYRLAQYELMGINEGDENYYLAKQNVEIKEHEYRVSDGNVRHTRSNIFSKLMDKFMRIFDLGDIRRCISVIKRTVEVIKAKIRH